MADLKISELTNLTAADPANDMIPIVDVSATPPASGSTKRISINNILACSPTATLASATITGNLTVDTNTLFVDSANDRVGMGTVTPVAKLIVRDGSNRNLLVASDATHLGSTGIAIGSFTDNAADWAPLSLVAKTQIAFGLNGSTAMTLNSTGLGVGVTPTAGRGAVQLSAGIGFPATQVASSDANTLDDYEEGTWSPTIIASSGTPTTVTVNSATYTKIGRLVVCSFDFSIVNIGTASSSLQFSLPFTAETSASFCGVFREKATTGSMGQVFYNSATDASCLLYNNNTVWVNGYRISGNYTYFAA